MIAQSKLRTQTHVWNAEFDILPIMNHSRLENATDVIHFNLLIFRPIYYSVSTRKWKSIGIGNSTCISKTKNGE